MGLDRVLSVDGGGDIGFKSPAVRAELNFEKLEGKASWLDPEWPLNAAVEEEDVVKSITGETLPGENRTLKAEGESDPEAVITKSDAPLAFVGVGEVPLRRDCDGGGGGGGGGTEGVTVGLEAGQHHEFSEETITTGRSSFLWEKA